MALTLHRALSPEKLKSKMLLKQFGLSPVQRLGMLVWGLLLAQVAVPIGSAIYFLVTQVSYQTDYKGDTRTWFFLKDTWDRLPVHIDNLFGVNWFHTANQLAPLWWITARHDFRKVLIGFLAALLIGAVTIGLKKRKQRTPLEMAVSVLTALVAAGITAAALIAFFARVTPVVNQLGIVSSNPWLSDWIGRGQIELFVIGFAAGWPAKKILARTFDTIQLMSLERNMAQNATEQWWWRFVYPPNYRQRFKLLVAEGHEAEQHSRWLGMTLTFGAPVLMFLAGFGVWLNYFGPASHA